MRDLIFVSLEPWDEIWRRNQFLCAELAQRFPSHRLLFVARPLFLPFLLRSFLRSTKSSGARLATLRASVKNRFRPVQGHPNLSVYTPLKWFPNPLPGARAWNEASMTRGIRRAAKQAGVRDPLLWLNPHDAGFLIDHLGERGVVYDITDDWELAAPDGPARTRIADEDRALCRRADLTVVCSQALFDSRKKVARRLLLLPNGVNADHYARTIQSDPRPPGRFSLDGTFAPTSSGVSVASNSSATAPTATAPTSGSNATPGIGGKEWPRPVFGYTGSLHRERIDLELVEQLAKRFPRGSIVIVGPQHWSDGSLARALQKHPNLHAPGAVAYASIPEVMARFDVCIVPHLCSEFVESLNPIKLWEFLACGKPIVSTDVAGFRDFPGLVRLAKDAPAFLEACREALQEVNACAVTMASEETKTTQLSGNGANHNDTYATNSGSPATQTRNEQELFDDISASFYRNGTIAANSPAIRCLVLERQREARHHSWSKRVDELLRVWRDMDLTGEKTEATLETKAPVAISASEEKR